MIEIGRALCSDIDAATGQEWLVTNGIGGYAMGTPSGVPSRRYHGLLVAALAPPLARTLLLAKLDETFTYDGQSYALFNNEWDAGSIEPGGHLHIERFRLEGTIPVWTFALADALLEKSIWMQPGENTTYIRYRLVRAAAEAGLNLKAIVNYRDHHGETRAGTLPIQIAQVEAGLRVTAGEGAPGFYLLSEMASAEPGGQWCPGYRNRVEVYRGFEAPQAHFYAGDFSAVLRPGESVTIAASTRSAPHLDGETALALRRAHESALLENFRDPRPGGSPDAIRQLVLAADQFIVGRSSQAQVEGQTVIAGYPWFEDWGRDTMIALLGLTLAAGRPQVARQLLRTFADFIDRGMLPNRFTEQGVEPEYNTVDATLWYFEAIRAYLAHSHCSGAGLDVELLQELYPLLAEIIDWHRRGTRYQIHLDSDGLIYAGEPQVQLTWMDARVGDWVVTPRQGKPVEINALWYNALMSMAEFAGHLGQPAADWQQLAEQTRLGFERYWNPQLEYCYDLLDGPAGDDPALRPNQLFAISLHHAVLEARHHQAVVDLCARRLYSPYGLRSLDPAHADYGGRYGGDQRQRDANYHQGTVWGWLMGPFAEAHLKVYRDPVLTWSYVEPLTRQLHTHGVGSLSEIFDGDPPFRPRGCIAQAWTVAEVLRIWMLINDKSWR